MALVGQFLSNINEQIRQQQGDLLRAWLQVEPSSAKQYYDLGAELRTKYTAQGNLDAIVEARLPQDDDVAEDEATVWPGFVAFMKDYLTFWRDVEFDDLLKTHELLTGLVNACATAFAHPTYGGMLLHASMSLSESLARFTLALNRRPDLTSRLRFAVDEDSNRKSVAESSAEIIQKIFTTCLTDRTSGRYSKPEGKKIGVYMFANLVLKLLFACRRTGLAKMIFRNISTISPPLSLYPAAQRVTYLYYLGRFNLANNHILRAALCLEQAYLQTPAQLVAHRTNILSFLMPCNILLGRFPTNLLFQRPEAETLRPVFYPLCQAIRTGDWNKFQDHLALHEEWLWDKGLFIALTYQLRPLLWRTLTRKTFMLTYVPPTDAASRKAATLDLHDLHTAAVFVQRRLEGWLPVNAGPRIRPPHINSLFMKAVSNNAPTPSEATTLAPPPGGPKRLQPNEGVICGNMEVGFDDVEMMVATLIQQEFMHGFIAHDQARFAIIGAKAKGPLAAGWPTVWQAIGDRVYDQPYNPDEVPGWVRD